MYTIKSIEDRISGIRFEIDTMISCTLDDIKTQQLLLEQVHNELAYLEKNLEDRNSELFN